MKPTSIAEVNAIRRLIKQGYCNKEIAHRVGRSSGLVARVRRGAVAGKAYKITPMDRIDILAWWRTLKSLPTLAQMARKHKVSRQYLRYICREEDARERAQAQRIGAQHEARA